ncbi:solute carrier organic anion transporter family member 74D-like, partial [Oppia nitens]|uniref:solute carrier organic anion transporter family member 74D-like n=1 Tax=Oppia nitens TaxID=1686743 RepID=UPI0023D98F27
MAIYASVESLADNRLCGLGSWRPKSVQSWATPKVFIFIFGLLGIIMGAPYTYMVASLTTLERRYGISSLVMGFILTGDDFAGLIFRPFIGYYAHRLHRPRFIGYATLIMAAGCFIGTLPYFVYGSGFSQKHTINSDTNKSSVVEFCDALDDMINGTKCDHNVGSTGATNEVAFVPVLFLWLSTFFIGLGSTTYYIIGIPFIDDSVKKKESPIYFALLIALRMLGPASAKLLSSLVLLVYENPFYDTGITDLKDPRWVGAWWVGFIVIGFALIITCLPMFMFPAELQTQNITSNDNHEDNNKQKQIHNDNVKQKQQAKTLKEKQLLEMGVLKRILRLMKNPIFLCVTIGGGIRIFGVAGFGTFKGKYIESMYKKSASMANLVSGLVGIVPSVIGIILGGAIITFLTPGPGVLTTYVTFVELFGSVGYLAAMWLGCPQTQYSALPGSTSTINYIGNTNYSSCLSNCACTGQTFHPICGPDNYTNYFSPCFAGCPSDSLIKMTNSSKKLYSGCECIGGEATDGYCDANCGSNFEIYLTVFSVAHIIGRIASIGNMFIGLRIVDPVDKSFAWAVSGTFYSLFVFIPYPMVYGAIANSACMVWETKCGQTGNCQIYDSEKLKNRLLGTTVGLILIGFIFDLIVIILSSRIKHLYDDEEEDEQ